MVQYFCILTLKAKNGEVVTRTGTFELSPDNTRKEAYTQIRTDLIQDYPIMDDATVIFFFLEKNSILD